MKGGHEVMNLLVLFLGYLDDPIFLFSFHFFFLFFFLSRAGEQPVEESMASFDFRNDNRRQISYFLLFFLHSKRNLIEIED